jgi:hypothetical protein
VDDKAAARVARCALPCTPKKQVCCGSQQPNTSKLGRRTLGGVLAGMLALPYAALAETSFPLPASKPVLTISGHIGRTNVDDKLVLDRATLEAIGEDGFETNTPWYTGTVRFDGIPLARLMQAIDAKGTTLRALALNDYTTDIPMADFERFGVLRATKRNGQIMPVRDKGPFFIVYPFDRFPELQTHQYYSRSAWQVASLIVG